MANNNIVQIAHRIKYGDIIAKFQDRLSQELLYKNKEKLKGKTAKDLCSQDENLLFINKSMAFDTKKLLCNIWQKCREIGIKSYHWYRQVKRDERGSKWKTVTSKRDLYMPYFSHTTCLTSFQFLILVWAKAEVYSGPSQNIWCWIFCINSHLYRSLLVSEKKLSAGSFDWVLDDLLHYFHLIFTYYDR